MADGPEVSTYTLLVDKVELQGAVYDPDGSVPKGEPLGLRREFDLNPTKLDKQYACLLAAVPGNGFLHCTMAVPPANESNKPDPGTI